MTMIIISDELFGWGETFAEECLALMLQRLEAEGELPDTFFFGGLIHRKGKWSNGYYV